MTTSRTASVDLGERRTTIEFGAGFPDRLPQHMRTAFPKARACGLAVDEQVASLWPLPALEGWETHVVRLPRGEAAKERSILARLQDAWVGLRRDEPVVVMGGGATLDVGGFAAATVRRGLPWIAVPTTVVGMADASVGGKTAVNHPAGKNLLGTFHAPTHVHIDVGYLETLDERDRIAGLAEVYKVARVGDDDLLRSLRDGAPDSDDAWIRVLHRAVEGKARLVEQDERDGGVRRLLNYGHTVGHALETRLGNDRVRHGEAVAIGMEVAASIAVARGLITESERTQQRADLAGLGLPTGLPEEPAPDEILAALSYDKKRGAGASHTFILPVSPLSLAVHDDVTDQEILTALASTP